MKIEPGKMNAIKTNEEMKKEVPVTTNNTNNSNNSNEEFRKKMLVVMGIILGIVAIILLILFLVSIISPRKYSYESVEEIMKDACVEYMQDHKKKLPKDEYAIVSIEDSDLINGKYMKSLSEYLGEDSKCTGRVEVTSKSNGYNYTPYLECGDGYETVEMYQKITKDNKEVTEGYGLYKIGTDYVFRGERVNNYIKIGEDLWRVVKVDESNELTIIKNDVVNLTESWDDRYNAELGYSAGYNDYRKSRILDLLKELLNNSNEYLNFSKEDKKNLTTFNVCIGKRDTNNEVRDGSVECSDILETQAISLLNTNDYMNASVDSECKRTVSKSCQNYNYLNIEKDWWLATASNANSASVYRVDNNGIITESYASGLASIRPVLKISSRAMYKSGKGTEANPYIMR